MNNYNITEQDQNEFIQWLKDTRKPEYKLRDVFVNNNGEIKIEKKMALSINITPNDWKESCDVTGRDYRGEINLLAIY